MSQLSYKTLFIILFLLLIPVVFLIRINQKPTKTLATWWSSSWNYRTSINIGNSGTPQTDIQIKILDNYDLSALISAGKIQASLNDLRFIDTSGEIISYWIEDATESSVDIWGIIPSLSTGNSIIYMYYGNPSAYSASSTSNITIGGTMSFIDGYRIHTFKDSGTLTNTTSTNVEILVVASGGGGAAMTGGGGGAGGLIYNSSFAVTNQNYSVTVGLGGSGQVGTANPGNGSDGQNSIFDSLIAIGGGGAGTNSGVGRSGGSGGGAGHNNTPGGVGTSGQGNNGSGGLTTAPNYGAGGGGGAGAVGGTPTNYAGGNGGVGLAYSISGTSQYYAGGGGGGTYMGGTLGLGGSGGGGDAPAGNAIPNTGGGGGGQRNNLANAGNGGSGIIILRFSSAITNSPGTEETRSQGINIGGTGDENPSGNLVAYYKFDEGYGTVANNSGSIGSTANGTLAAGTSSPTWTTGKVGKSLSFDGNDYVSGTLSPSKSFTISGWIKPTGLGTDSYQNIFGWDNTNYNLIYYRPATNTIEIWNNADGNRTGIGVSANQWNHFAYVREGDSITNGRKTYINGLLVDQANSSVWTLPTSVFNIGRDPNANWRYQGLIDEVKIYDYPLSDNEIKIDYNQGSSIVFSVDKLNVGSTSTSAIYCVPGSIDPCSPPITEWNFEESVGTSAFDTSVSANHGSLTNTSWSTGKVGKALQFNSTNSSYLISSSDPGTMSSGTYSLWVKASNINAAMGWIDSNFDIFQWTGNLLYFRAGNQSSVSISNWIPNTWHHVTLMWNGSNYYGYIDGKEVTSGVQSGSRSGAINLGRVDNNYYFDGSIDQIRIYNYARTPAQIGWDYNQGAPIGWWRFDECTGTNIKDWSFNGNTGIATIGAGGSQTSVGTCTTPGTAWGIGATGKFNSSLNFDGTDDHVSINSINLSGTDKISLSFWFKFSGNTIKIIYEYSSNFNANNAFLIDHSERGIAGSLQISDHTPSGYNISYTSRAYNDNQWHHYLGIIDRGLGVNQNKIYIDGKEDSIQDSTYRTDLSGNFGGPFPLYISSRGGSSYFYSGLIDDFRIYNYALTSEQIKLIYNGGAINFDKLN